MAFLNDLSTSEDAGSQRSRWLWALLAFLLLLLMLGLIWVWWSASKAASHPLAKVAVVSSEAAAPPPPAPPPPAVQATFYDVQFGYHQSAITTKEELESAFNAWRSDNDRQCGNACSCKASARINIIGHADRRTGTRAFNKCISWKRASVVADALVSQGVPRCDVTAGFVGDSDTPSPEPDEATAAKHRHASIMILSGNSPGPSCIGACRSSLSRSDLRRCEVLLKQPPLRKIAP